MLTPKNNHRHFDGERLYFHMLDDKKVVICMVSREALDDYFRIRGQQNNYEELFDQIRDKCELIANNIYAAGRLNDDGRVLIGTHDLNF